MKLYLDSKQTPHVIVKVDFPGSNNEIDCIIDTGFSGTLAIPNSLRKRFNVPRRGMQRYLLADGTEVTYEIYRTRVAFASSQRELNFMFTQSESGLVGIEFLRGFKFVLDLKLNLIKLD